MSRLVGSFARYVETIKFISIIHLKRKERHHHQKDVERRAGKQHPQREGVKATQPKGREEGSTT